MKIEKSTWGVACLITGTLVYANLYGSYDDETERKLRKPLAILMIGVGGILLYQAMNKIS